MFSILLVDDEATEREGLAFLLKQGGYSFDIYQAPNGKRAWELMQQRPADVLLTDVKMPHMDGLELSKLVSEYFPGTVIIVYSAYSEFEYARRAMDAKAIHYLLKPIEVGEFNQLMARVVSMCEEAARRQVQHTRQAEYQRELAVMRALSGSQDAGDWKSEIQQCGLSLDGQYLRLAHLEMQGTYFARRSDDFRKLLNACCPFGHVAVSFYPNAFFLLLYDDAILKSEETADFAQRLCRDMRQIHGQSASILCGGCVRGVESLPAEAAALIKCRKRLYTAQDSVLFVHGDLVRDASASPGVESARSSLETAIERRDQPEIARRVSLLFQELRQSRTLESTYLNHILYDLVTRLYIRFDRYSSQTLGPQMDALLDCPDIDWMERRIQALAGSLATRPHDLLEQRGHHEGHARLPSQGRPRRGDRVPVHRQLQLRDHRGYAALRRRRPGHHLRGAGVSPAPRQAGLPFGPFGSGKPLFRRRHERVFLRRQGLRAARHLLVRGHLLQQEALCGQRHLPETFDEYIAVCKRFMELGIKPLSAGLKSWEPMLKNSMAFVTAEYLSTDEGKDFGAKYREGTASLNGTWNPYIEKWSEMITSGIYTTDMTGIDHDQALNEFALGGAAMFCSGPWDLEAILAKNPELDLDMMPFYGTKESAGWLIGGPGCGFAANASSDKLDAVMRVLDAISSVAGQEGMSAGQSGGSSYLLGVESTLPAYYTGVKSAIEAGNVYCPWNEWGDAGSAHHDYGVEMQNYLLGQDLETTLSNVDTVVREIMSK